MAVINGTAANDLLGGSTDRDWIDGNGGDDQISGGAGNDDLAGNAGSDVLGGGEGDDILWSGDRSPPPGPAGYDPWSPPLLDTGVEIDTLLGGPGADRLFAGYGDNVDGGDGIDAVYLSFQGAGAGVVVDFHLPVQTIGGGQIVNIENVSWLQGSEFADFIDAGSDAATGYPYFAAVFGMGGDDSLIGGQYTGWMDGGEGADLVDGTLSPHAERISGGAGDDTLYTNTYGFAEAHGGDGNDTIYAHGTIFGGGGNDLIVVQGSYFPGIVQGDAGDDDIRAAAMINAAIAGGSGADRLTGNTGDDVLTSGDFLPGSRTPADDIGIERDVLTGLGGQDTLSAGYGDDVDGGSGTDMLRLSLGGAAAGVTLDTAALLSGQVFVLGGGTIRNVEVLSYLRGTDFADVLTLASQAVSVEVEAGDGDDLMTAGASPVLLNAGGGDDRFVSGPAADRFNGGEGRDTVDYSSSAAGVEVALGPSGDAVLGPDGDVLVDVENVYGSGFNDRLDGNADANDLRGFAGDDVLNGGDGDDLMDGGNGDDVLNGGDGNDVIRGFGGNDLIDGGLGDDDIDGGDGNDVVTVSGAQMGTGLRAVGGAGSDTLVIANNGGSFWGTNVREFETLSLRSTGQFLELSGFTNIALDLNVRAELSYSQNPNAAVALSGNIFVLGLNSTIASLTGSSNTDVFRIALGASVSGNVDLGDGFDRFGTGAATLSTGTSPFGGLVSGGAGFDEVLLGMLDGTPNVVEHYAMDLSRLVDFESLSLQTFGLPGTPRFVADVSILGAQGYTNINLGGFGRYSLGPAALAGASVWLGEGSELTIQSGAAVNSISITPATPDLADDYVFVDATLINHGRVAGGVTLGAGHDLYDGRTGSVDGNVSGGAGHDTLLGGSAGERLLGEGGNDILSGGGGADVLTGGVGADTFRDTLAGLNGDTIADFGSGDRILFTDASISTFSYSLAGNVLLFSGGSLTLVARPAGRIVAEAAPGGGVQLIIDVDAKHDFNGDGRTDLFWRHGNGEFVSWSTNANGGYQYNAVSANRIDSSWSVVGLGDYNGDGRDDIMWRHVGGELAQWLGQANGGFVHNGGAAWRIDANWRVVGTGDFNGDGRDDLIWRHVSGEFAQWLGQPDGSFLHSGKAANAAGMEWSIVGTGDFNGDGRDDILWRHSGGHFAQWLGQADATFINNSAGAFSAPINQSVAGIGDFDGDGRSDILLRDGAGNLLQWRGQADGSFVQNNLISSQVPLSWEVAQVGDFNGDGRDDILWRHTSGELAQWSGQANGTFTYNAAGATTLDPGWVIQHPALLLF